MSDPKKDSQQQGDQDKSRAPQQQTPARDNDQKRDAAPGVKQPDKK